MTKILNINMEKQPKKEDATFKELSELRRMKETNKKEKPMIIVEFSWKLVVAVLALLALIFFSKQILSVLVFLFLSFVLMSAVLPVVNWFGKRKVSKGLAIGITYLIGIVVLIAITAVIVIPFINQVDNLVESVPEWVKQITGNISAITLGDITIDSNTIYKGVLSWFEKFTSGDSFENIASTLGGVFGWASLVLASVVFSIYLVIDHNKILDFGLIRITSDEKRDRVKKLVLDLEAKLGKWLLGQGVVSTIAGGVLGLSLALFGIPFALPMGVLIALFSAIPSLGATVASIPPLIIALIVKGPVVAVVLLLIFLVYQQLENNFIIPKVMGGAAGVKPMLVLFSAIIFLILFGVWGAVLSVPAIVIGKICYEFYIDLQKIEAKGSIN